MEVRVEKGDFFRDFLGKTKYVRDQKKGVFFWQIWTNVRDVKGEFSVVTL